MNAAYPAIHGTDIIWVDASRKKLMLRPPSPTDILIRDVSSQMENYLQYPVFDDRLIAWSEDGADMAFDRKLHEIVQLSAHRLFGRVFLHGSTLAWQNTDTPKVNGPGTTFYSLLDTRDLPRACCFARTA